MSGIDWRLLQMPDVGGNTLAAFEKGAELGRAARRSRALADFVKNPTSPESVNALIAAGDPETALRLRDLQFKEQDREREAKFRGAQTRYFSGGNALVDHVRRSDPGLVPHTAVQTAPALDTGAPTQAQPQVQPQAAPHVLGEPQDDSDRAFLEMLSLDPKRAMEMESGLQKVALDRLSRVDKAYDHALVRLANVTSEEGYQALLAQMDERLGPLGVDIRSMVPDKFPGPQGMRKLLMMTMEAKDQLHAIVERERLDTYAADIDADNARADRNTNSIIADRDARRTEARRWHDQQDKTTRRGQDGRRQRGGGGAPSSARPTATGPNGQKVQWNGKAWVPVG